MAKRKPSNIREFLDIARRRMWWLLVPTVVITLGTFFVSLRLPRVYRSVTMIMVEPQKVPVSYVQSTISNEVSARLQSISQEILSRTRLQKIIDQFKLYGSLRGKLSAEEMIDSMRKDITVDLIQSSDERDRSIAGFKISYSGTNPALVQMVTRQLASLFIEENLKSREQQAEGTTDFLEDELEKTRQVLQEQEGKIEAFKAAHAGELPEQQGTETAMLGQLQAMVQTNADAIARAQQQKDVLVSLTDNLQQLTPPQSMKSALELQYENKRNELLAAEQKYRDAYPDIIRLKAELKALRGQLDSEKGQNVSVDGRTTQTPGQIRVEIAGLTEEIKQRNARQKILEDKVQHVQAQLSALPQVEQQLAILTRDHDTTRTNYQAMLTKRNESSVAADVERHAKGEQFRIQDPASRPEKPYKPNLVQIDLLGLFMGLSVGVLLVFLLELMDHTLHSDKDVTFYTNLPMLASIPLVWNEEERERNSRRRRMILAASCVVVLVTAAACFHLRSSIATGFGWRF